MVPYSKSVDGCKTDCILACKDGFAFTAGLRECAVTKQSVTFIICAACERAGMVSYSELKGVQMVHCYKQGGLNIVLDTFSGSIHVVDDAAYDIIEEKKDIDFNEI